MAPDSLFIACHSTSVTAEASKTRASDHCDIDPPFFSGAVVKTKGRTENPAFFLF